MTTPRIVLILVLALLGSLASGTVRPAAAGDWYIGAGFQVGGVHFSVAFDRHHGYRGPSHHYYRTRGHVRHDGYRCGSACFKRSGYAYHYQACPLVLQHFRWHGFHPARAWDTVDRRYRSWGYDSYRGYDRRHRWYERRYDRWYDRRYDVRDRHRGHHPDYCPYR